MSTRCAIGIENSDKTVDAIYCHSDGYLEGVGKILKEYYEDEETVRKLIDIGKYGLSSLGRYPKSKTDQEERELYNRYWATYNEEYLNMCKESCTVFDEEAPIPISIYNNAKEYEAKEPFDREYLYLFRKGTWRVYKSGAWRKF